MADEPINGLNEGKKRFVKPELVVLDVRSTQTGVDDPNEFEALIGPVS